MTANPEHFEILKQGVYVWNKWRATHREIIVPDLMYAHLKNANLNGADLKGVNLKGANLNGADLREAYLIGADLKGAHLLHADLIGADLSGADLSGAQLKNANLNGAHLIGAHLIGADLKGAHLKDANLKNSNLKDANLNGAHLRDTNLRDTNLRDASLKDANIIGAHLNGANLSGANLNRAIVNGADFTYSIMGDTTLAGIDLREAKGLITVRHIFPSTIGINTIYKSAGKIPEVFLRGCGVPDNFITYMHSLAKEAIQFYSCFISYSSKDQDFANRLYSDLQNKGVRCWFAPEDLKIGDKIRDRIDESIRLRDKLLLILSENSIASEWVEHEVESALEEERRTSRSILFPIRLNDAVMESNKAWTSLIRRMRHIGDFTRWKDHDSYQKSFDRLLRDLKAESNQAAEGKSLEFKGE